MGTIEKKIEPVKHYVRDPRSGNWTLIVGPMTYIDRRGRVISLDRNGDIDCIDPKFQNTDLKKPTD